VNFAATNIGALMLYTVSQKTSQIFFDCNLKKNEQILIIFRETIPEITGHQIIT